MAELPVIDGVFRVALNWHESIFNATATNVMHFVGVSGDADALHAALVAHVATASHLFQPCAPTISVNNIEITPLDGSTASSVYPSGGTGWQGQTSGTPVLAAAAIVKIQTAKRGRSTNGRIFLPCLGEDAINGSTIQTSQYAAWQGSWATFNTAMAADGFSLGVASYKHATFEPATSLHEELYLATQRRRQSRLRP